MTEVTLENIRAAALRAHQNHETWHFHILSPICAFNTTNQYAFILEHRPGEPLVHYSNRAEKDLGAELSPLLHRPESVETEERQITADQQRILDIAKLLSEHGTAWHHHVLFPGCIFNEQSGNFCLILENPETGEVSRALSDDEPQHVLKELEPLFYRKA